MLIEKGADMYHEYLGNGWMAGNCLHTAIWFESIDVVRFLVKEMNMVKERRTKDYEETALELSEWIGTGYGTETMDQIVQLLQS